MLRKSLVTGVGVALLVTAAFSPSATAQALPDLEVDKAILGNLPTVSPGQEFSYAIVVTNQGASMAAGSLAKVLDQLPPKVDLVLAEEGARGKEPFYLGVTCTQSAPNVLCVGPALTAGDYYVVRIIVRVQTDAKAGNLVNHAFADPFDEVVEGDENNNHDKVKAKIQ